MVDKYTKTCLTIIAISLSVIAINQVVSEAYAYGHGQEVRVTNFPTNRSPSSETLYVYCTNC